MPHVAITMIPGRSLKIKTDLAKKVQEVLADELNLNKNYISVSIEDIPLENWQESINKISDDTMILKPGV